MRIKFNSKICSTFINTLVFIILLFGCSKKDICQEKLLQWRQAAPIALKDFDAIQNEIELNRKAFYIQGESSYLYIRHDFPERIEKENNIKLPLIKKWFSEYPGGYIDFKNNRIQIQFRDCHQESKTYFAKLYYSESGISPSFTHNLVAEIADSVKLRANWYFIVTKCEGCGN